MARHDRWTRDRIADREIAESALRREQYNAGRKDSADGLDPKSQDQEYMRGYLAEQKAKDDPFYLGFNASDFSTGRLS